MKLKLISEKLTKMANPLKKRQGFAGLVLGTALALLPAINAEAQMNKWVMPPTSLGMASSPISSSALYPGAPSSDQYFVSNGAYDNSGNLLFFVKDNTVYNKTNGIVGPLGDIHGGSGTYLNKGGEIAIVPIPGTCASFYVIYSRANLWSQNGCSSLIGYIKVDCSTPTAPIITYDPTYGGPTDAFVVNPSDYGAINSSIAVSKKIGTGASATYYLYYTTSSGPGNINGQSGSIGYAIINSSGINATGYIAGGTLDDLGWSPELELSEDGNWLAVVGRQSPFTNYDPIRVNVFNISGHTTFVSVNVFGAYTRVSGLEFVGSGMPDLYVGGIDWSGNAVFDQIDLATGNITNRQGTLSGHNLQFTFLEYAKNGFLYGIEDGSPNPTLIEYLPDSTSGGSVNNTYVLNMLSNAAIPGLAAWPYRDQVTGTDPDTYTLPDQIDGADYSHFNTPIQITGMSINGWVAQNDCGTAYEIFACEGVHLTAFTTDDLKACSQKLTITPYNPSDCEDITATGVGLLHYLGEVKGAIRDLAIHTLRDDYGNSLMTVEGFYKVTLTITDCCGNSTSMTEFIRMKQAPHINLEVFNGPGGSLYMPAGFFHSSPLGTGALSIGFKVNLSTGVANNMNVIVDQLTGTWGGAMSISNILNQDVAVTNLSSITNEQLNNYCVPTTVTWPIYPGPPTCNVTSPSAYSGNPNFFSSNNTSIVGNYYRLTVTLSNECGTSSDYAYMQISDAYQRLTSVQELVAEKNAAQVYPNPANDKIQISIKSRQSDMYQITLYDLSGRIVKTIADKMSLDAGDHTLDVNTSDLQTGVYTWKINSQGINQNGLISVMK